VIKKEEYLLLDFVLIRAFDLQLNSVVLI